MAGKDLGHWNCLIQFHSNAVYIGQSVFRQSSRSLYCVLFVPIFTEFSCLGMLLKRDLQQMMPRPTSMPKRLVML
jgi:hypothetical protein